MAKIKVAIIGAGPSGFAVSEVLRNDKYSKYFDVTIYEKNDYVGGKCKTVNTRGDISNGQSGGYEVGAVIASEHAEAYSSLIKLLDKYEIKRTIFNPRGSGTFTYLNKSKVTNLSKVHLRDFKTNPLKFWKVLKGYNKFITDYIHYSHSVHPSYSNRPKALNKNLSKLYRSEVNEALSGVMQGYGYADLDDKKLSPPLIYYHQYVRADEIEYPLHKIDTGTQGIWHRIASTYPKSTIKLNEQVIKTKRDAFGVEVITDTGSKKYDYLVIATPFKPALKFLDLDEKEKAFLSQMKHNHYVTILCEVSGLENTVTFNVQACTNKKYLGRVLCAYKRYPDSDLAVLYLYAKPGQDDSSILKEAEKSIKEDFNSEIRNVGAAKVFHWEDYFGHLDTKSLNERWYDKFDEYFQGKNRTLYVSSGLHMETIGASVEFGTKLASQYADIWLGTGDFS